ncbi:MAG: phosphoserine phosphatase RsbU/P [Thermoanaerobaculia bacterium]|jgi:sigma-B regulation protein RsbU (phosphoserine phosphatase)|nr:phosphoserine phosphatase RsbU/P [Thermoanaerobaculia bacterium]
MSPLVHQFAEFLHDLQQLERAALSSHGSLILDAFTKHTPFDVSAVYLRDARGPVRLAAKSDSCIGPDILEDEEIEFARPLLDPPPRHLIPIRTIRDHFGIVALIGDAASDEDLQMLHAAGAFAGSVLNNHRLAQEMREGDFQLKYRLWELESLYDIGLSIAGTLNIDALADEILFRMISLINARRAALFLRDGDKFRVYRSFGDTRSDFLDDEITDRVVAAGEALTFEDASECIFPGCIATVAVPIKGNNAVIGVLAAGDRETREGDVGAFEANELRLLSLFANQVAIALENARLHKEALEKQAMQRELDLAATIQRDILPKSIPTIEGIDLAALSRPAKQVGGDYHAFFQREGTLTTIVADVSGKSMPAALLVSAFHAAVQLLFAEGRELGDIATELNRHIHSWSAENKFITMIMVTIDPEAETIQFVNAGHNPCYVLTGDRIEQLRSHGLPIGILGTSKYMTQTRPFASGSAVVLYSDGINEAENMAGDEWGNEAFEELLGVHTGASAGGIRDAIANAVDAFVAEAPQKDDQTLVIGRTARRELPAS